MSTGIELLGFISLDLGAWRFGTTTGLIVSGLFLLLIGYSMDDKQPKVSAKALFSKLRERFPSKKS